MAGVGEPEFLEEDHGPGVRVYFQGFDLRGGGGEEHEEEKEEDRKGLFRHFRRRKRRISRLFER